MIFFIGGQFFEGFGFVGFGYSTFLGLIFWGFSLILGEWSFTNGVILC